MAYVEAADCRAQRGRAFDRTLTLGRQNFFVDPPALSDLFQQIDGRLPEGFDAAMARADGFADEFFKLLGATDLVTVDASAYEGAAVVHDMNTPVAPSFHEQYDVVLDGGTLEHVFNFPVSIRNCMEMVKVGGTVFIATPTNGFVGHGFYQFSPELFYRVFSSDNGFAVRKMVAVEMFPRSQWYEVADPAAVGARVELVPSEHRILLLVQAQRTEKRPIFSKVPQQSDYVSTWTKQASGNGPQREPKPRPQPAQSVTNGARAARGGMIRSVIRRVAPGVEMWIRSRNDARVQRRLGLHVQPQVFRPVDR